MKPSICSLLVAVALSLTACAVEDDKGAEEDAPSADGKDDSLIRPTAHGAIGFDDPRIESLTADAGHHAWTFELGGDAEVDVFTGPGTHDGDEVDTVLYLYRQRANGSWGPYIARNDDAGDALWSSIDRALGAGTYRVTVKGYRRDVRGELALTVHCEGDGCGVPAVGACTLGDTYGSITEQPHLEVLDRNTVTAATTRLSDLDKQRIVLAVQQSSHTDVTTIEEAFARVDQGEIIFTWIAEAQAQRRYVAVEYGAGDNSYGAVFGRRLELIASIHDGDLLGCELPRATCLLSDTFYEMRDDTAFTAGANRVVTATSSLTTVEAAQLLATFVEVYDGDVTTIPDGFALADRNQVNLQPYTHRATGAELTVVEHGAGDTSVGMIFFAGTTEVAGVISDSSIEHCAFVE